MKRNDPSRVDWPAVRVLVPYLGLVVAVIAMFVFVFVQFALSGPEWWSR